MGANVIDLVCREVVEMVSEYLGHVLTAEDHVRFEKHLLTCPPCTNYLAQMKATLEMAGGLGKTPPTPEVEQELLTLFRRWHQR